MKPHFRHRSLLCILALSPFLVQCVATTQDVRTLDLRLRTMNNKLISMDRNVNDLQAETAARANKSSVDDLQKNQADTSNSLDYLKTQLLQTKGQIEENTHHIQKLQEDEKFYRDSQSDRLHDLSEGIENLRITLDDLQNRLAALEKKNQSDSAALQLMTGDLEKIKEARANEAAERAKKAAEEASRAARIAEEAREAKLAEEADTDSPEGNNGASAKGKEPAAGKKANGEGDSSTAKEKSGSKAAEKKKTPGDKKKAGADEKAGTPEDPAKKLYDDGMAAFNAKKYQEAYAIFNRYLEKYPKGSLAANARYWLGESLYSRQDYELAILEYQKVIADFPKNTKSAAALLKQGMSFEKLKDQETAKLVYLKLQSDFRDSEEAAAAKKRLQELK